MKYFVFTVIGIVTAAVIAGFFVAGSPGEERLRRFDERRLGDLQFLQSEIINYWQRKKVLPASLAALQDDIRGVRPPIDPETGEAYGYAIKGPETFELCAVFARPSIGREGGEYGRSKPQPLAPEYYPYGADSWEHTQGRVCFERTIDKDLYKPNFDPALPI